MNRRPFALLVVVLAFGGCGDGEEPPPPSSGGHRHVAPHGGALVELGEEAAHVEVVLEPGTGRLTLYVLDGEAEEGVRVQQGTINLAVKIGDAKEIPLNVDGVESAVTGETRTDTSEFAGTFSVLEGVRSFGALIYRLEVKGRVFQRVEFRYPEGNEP